MHINEFIYTHTHTEQALTLLLKNVLWLSCEHRATVTIAAFKLKLINATLFLAKYPKTSN